MGVTAMIPDATIGQLRSEAVERWGEIWDPAATRTRVMMMMPRDERKLYEMHGDLVEHGQPVVSIFHRPRAEGVLLEEQGLNHREASFLFVDLASSDLGRWLQHLVTNEGWLRGTLVLHPVPFEVGLPMQRRFEAERLLLFRHPSLPSLDRYYLPFPLDSLPGKAFVSLPTRAAAEHARQQAEVLGVGRLERPNPEAESPPTLTAASVDHALESSSVPPENLSAALPVPLPAHDPTEREETLLENVSRRVDEAMEAMVGGEATTSSVPLPVETQEETAFEATPPSADLLEVPAVEGPQVEVAPAPAPDDDGMSPIEREFRDLVAELMSAGVEPSAMMDDPRWEGHNERAVAAGIDAWGIFVGLIEEQG
jgi:hypothetical protein